MKVALQSAIDSRRDLPPLSQAALARTDAELQDQVHREVTLRGLWQPGQTLFLENRQMAGRPGFFVLTPFTLADGSTVIVQRGWIPRDPYDRVRVSSPPLPAGEAVLTGRIAPPPARLFEFGGAVSGTIRQNLDLELFARETGLRLRPLSVQQLAGVADLGEAPALLREWPRPATDVHKHYGYAFQWFALSALTVLLYVWFQILRPRRRPSPDA
jgi:surfeit locus 1 family protein